MAVGKITDYGREDENHLVCDICGEEITSSYYEMPDGYTVCEDEDCLKEWMHEFKRPAVVH